MSQELKTEFEKISNQDNIFKADRFDERKKILEDVLDNSPKKKKKLTVDEFWYLLALLEPYANISAENQAKHDEFCKQLIIYLKQQHLELFKKVVTKAFVANTAKMTDLVHRAVWNYLDRIKKVDNQLAEDLFKAASSNFNYSKVMKAVPTEIKEAVLDGNKTSNTMFNAAIKSNAEMAYAFLLERSKVFSQKSSVFQATLGSKIKNQEINHKGIEKFVIQSKKKSFFQNILISMYGGLKEVEKSEADLHILRPNKKKTRNGLISSLANFAAWLKNKINDKIKKQTPFIIAVKAAFDAVPKQVEVFDPDKQEEVIPQNQSQEFNNPPAVSDVDTQDKKTDLPINMPDTSADDLLSTRKVARVL